MSYAPALAVDLGGTFLRSAVVHSDGHLARRTRLRLRTVFDGETPEGVWDTIVARLGALSDDAQAELANDAPLVVAFPGPVTGTSILVCAPTLTGDARVPSDLAARIVARAGRPIRILNDVAAAALYLARTTDSRRFMVITVSSGIGSRVVLAGMEGTEPPYSGEIGHIVVNRDAHAIACDCGGRGHLGSLASGRGIERAARAAAARSHSSFAASACFKIFGATAGTLNNEEHLVPAILAGDPWATGFLERAIQVLAPVVLHAIVAAGLERVYVIGGFATALSEHYATLLESALRRLNDSPATALPVGGIVRVASLSDEACLLGAAALT